MLSTQLTLHKAATLNERQFLPCGTNLFFDERSWGI